MRQAECTCCGVVWWLHVEYVKTPTHVWTWAERIWGGEIARMLWRVRPVWEITEQEPVLWDAINLIYELRALIWHTDWQHCEGWPTFLCECERQLTCFNCGALFFPELIWWRIECKLEPGVEFHCAQTSKKKLIFYTFFKTIFPPLSSSVTWELLHIDCGQNERNGFVAV